MSALQQLAEEFGALDHDAVPAGVRAAARHCILDWYGCAIAGQDEPLAGILRDELLGGTGPCRIVGRPETAVTLAREGTAPAAERRGAAQVRGLRGSRRSLMIRFWISLVPSKIVVSRASRQCRSTCRSVV